MSKTFLYFIGAIGLAAFLGFWEGIQASYVDQTQVYNWGQFDCGAHVSHPPGKRCQAYAFDEHKWRPCYPWEDFHRVDP